MASLRRPSAAISKALPGGSGARPVSQAPPDDSRRRDARKSKVGDKIRKRMSMRYLVGENLTPAPPMSGDDFLSSDPYGGLAGDAGPSISGDATPLPDDGTGGETYFSQFGSPEFAQSGFGTTSSLSASAAGGAGPAAALRAEEGIRRRGAADMSRDDEWDLEQIAAEGFDLAGFMRRTLAGADEEEKTRFRAAVMRAKQANAKELQRNVFKHYAEFVTISKEISTLENDMLELKELLGQWKDLPQLMGMEDTLAPTLDKNGNLERRRTQRNSVLDLQNMYKTQLTQLWSTVEGSQKYLPVVPGRHLVFETHNFVELNAATYKAKQSVSMFLLNDLLLIAGRRRMKGADVSGVGAVGADKERERGRMVAERCWVLADLVVVDIKDSGDLTNALKIRRGKEVCVYRTARPEDKKSLLAAFRQVSHELGEKKRKESEKEQERRKSMWHGDQGGSGPAGLRGGPPVPGLVADARGRPLSTIGVSMADSKDLRWIDEYGDELTMAIATRDWDEAVKLCEKGRDLLKTVSSNPSAHSLLSAKVDQLLPTLVSQLSFDLSAPSLRKTTAIRLISLLSRLDRADLARDTFLNARRGVMLSRVRGIKCEGDVSIYISELSIVCFTIVRHTSDWFMSAFKENRMASGFVNWAKEQIETYADMFRRQVYAPNIEQRVVDECIHVTASHNRKLLRDVGLDFTYLLSTLLQPDPTSSTSINSLFQSASTSTAQTPGPYHIESSPFIPLSGPETPGSTFDPASLYGYGKEMGRDRSRSGSSAGAASGAGADAGARPKGSAAATSMSRQASSNSNLGPAAPTKQRSTPMGREGSATSNRSLSSTAAAAATAPGSTSMGRSRSGSSFGWEEGRGTTQPLSVPSRTNGAGVSPSSNSSHGLSQSGGARSPGILSTRDREGSSAGGAKGAGLGGDFITPTQPSRAEMEMTTPTQSSLNASTHLQSAQGQAQAQGYSLGAPLPLGSTRPDAPQRNTSSTSPVLPPRSERRARPPPRTGGGGGGGGGML